MFFSEQYKLCLQLGASSSAKAFVTCNTMRTMGLKGGTGLTLYLSGRVVLSILGRLSHLIKKTE